MKISRNKVTVKIGGVDYSKNLALPFVMQDTGTEQLDSAIITLRNMRTDNKFAPFTAVELCGGKYTYIVADDRVTAVFGRSLWNHEITLVDETKILERILMEGKSFTQPITQQSTKQQDAECGRVTYDIVDRPNGYSSAQYDKIQTPIFLDDGQSQLFIPSPNTLVKLLSGIFSSADQCVWKVSVLYSKSTIAHEYGNNEGFEVVYGSVTITDGDFTDYVGITKPGIYTIRYDVSVNGFKNVYFIPISAVNKMNAPKKYSVYDVMQITLETAEPIFDGDKPRYEMQLTDEQEARFKAMDAPEMHFPNGRSLYENLKEIGDYIHALPKVKGGKVRWQELGSCQKADISKGVLYGQNTDFNASEYASTVEANFANLINSSDESEGSVTEPYTDGYITLRSNGYRIKEEDSFIPTSFPIGTKIKKVIVRVHDEGGNVTHTIDITPAVFEKNEYDLLTSFTGIYPFSKTHALYYTTGQKNIEGLWYRAEDSAISALNQFSRYAITNVINFFGGLNNKEYDYTSLSFQITYIPIINGRVRQERTESTEERVILAHNQSANQLSARSFGENLRGKVAMLANATESKQYMFPRFTDIPKGGEMYDRKKFISTVTTRVFPDYCLSQIDLSENYNNQGAFVQMKTGIRQYEIPAGQDRCTLLEEFCVIGKQEDDEASVTDGMFTLCREDIKKDTIYAFTNKPPKDISAADVITRDENNKEIAHVTLPVYSTSLGTSVYFGFSFADNFSAGPKSIDIGIDGARGTEFVEYGNPYFAKAKYIEFDLINKYLNNSQYSDRWLANSLPSVDYKFKESTTYISTKVRGSLVWNKDSADIGNIAYQLHFVSNDGYVINSELARMMPYVRSAAEYEETPMVYFYDSEIDELTGKATGNIVHKSDMIIDQGKFSDGVYCLEISDIPQKSYKSFVIKRENGECIIGKNTKNADSIIYFNFKRKR